MGGGGGVFIDNLPYKLIILWYATNIWSVYLSSKAKKCRKLILQ